MPHAKCNNTELLFIVWCKYTGNLEKYPLSWNKYNGTVSRIYITLLKEYVHVF